MDWFERLTGFRETSYAETKSRLVAENGHLRSLVNGKSYATGVLELPTLESLRQRASHVAGGTGPSKVSLLRGDVRTLHTSDEFKGALFQVASQFNALEMTSWDISPEDGVTRYETDHTQGPACAIAAGAATIYRNYFAPVGGGVGQTKEHQIDTSGDIRDELCKSLGRPTWSPWEMRNGYAICKRDDLKVICSHLAGLTAGELDNYRAKLRIALQSDVEVTYGKLPGQLVSQAFCSALALVRLSGLIARKAGRVWG